MAQHEVRFQLGLLDLWTLLFTKKLCPTCRQPMLRRTSKESTGTKWRWDEDTEPDLPGSA